MKKIYSRLSGAFVSKISALLTLLIMTGNMWGQVARNNFSQSAGTFSAISGGTLHGTAVDDNNYSFTLPFTFTYNGTGYTVARPTSNGFLVLGGSAPSASQYTPLSSGTTNFAISALGRDLNSTIRSEVLGTTPNRVYVCQWSSAYRYAVGSSENLNFQIRLYETTNEIEIIYGSISTPNTTWATGASQVGLRGSANTDFNVASFTSSTLTGYTYTLNWQNLITASSNTDVVGITSTIFPASGTTLKWSPSTCAQPTVSTTSTSITSTGFTIGWTNSATYSSGYDVRWRKVDDLPSVTSWATPTTVAAGSSSYAVTGLSNSTYYIYSVQGKCGASSQSNLSQVTTANLTNARGLTQTLAACPNLPSALTSNTITTTTANVAWTAASPAPGSGYEYFVSTSATAPTAGTTPTGSVGAGIVTAALTSLSPVTQYYYWVRSNCNGTDKSNWAGSGTFTTQILVATPYSEPFTTTTTPSGWDITGWTIGSIRGVTGNPGNNIYKNLYNLATTGTFTTINVGPISSGQLLTFDWKTANYTGFAAPGASTGDFVVSISTDWGATYTAINTTSSGANNTWNAYSYNLSSYAGQNIKIRIVGNRVSGDYDLAFDNFKIETPPSCLPPTITATTSITSTTATINWSAPSPSPSNGYQWEVRSSGAAGSGAIGLAASGTVAAGVLTASAAGLTGSIGYTVYVRSDCGGSGFSAWSSGGAFTTLKTEPTNQVTALAAGTVTASAIPLSWTAAAAGAQAPDGYLIKASDASLVAIADPSDGTDPADVTAFTSSSANKKQTTGSAVSTTSFTSMTAGTMYYYKVYSYTNSGTGINFNITSPAVLNHATLPNAATLPVFSTTTFTGTTLTWTAPVAYNASNHTTLVFVKATSAVIAGTPTSDPASYTANTTFASGTAFQGDASAYCVYSGDGTSVTITGLSASTTYHVRILTVVDAANSNGNRSYSTGLVGNVTTLKAEPTNQITALTAGAVTTSAIPLTWTAAAAGAQAPDGYLIKASDASLGAIADPSDGTDPADVTAFTSGAANKKQTTGSATSTTSFTSMTAGTMYYYKVYSYTNTGIAIDFNITSPATLNHATLPNAATLPVFSATAATSTTLSWTTPVAYNSSNHTTLVFVKATSAVTAGTPTNDPASYTANTTFASGTAFQGDASAYCVYSGDGTSVTITGLSAATTYHVRILIVVDAVNSNGNRSYSTGLEGNVTTLCAAVTSFPHSQSFATYLPVCWQEGDGGTLAAGPASIGSISTSEWVESGYLNSGTTGAAAINIYNAGKNEWFISPEFALPASPNQRLKYAVGATEYADVIAPTLPWEADDYVEVLISTTGMTSWTVLKTYNNTNVPSHLGQTEIFDLSAYAGQTIRLAYRAVEGASNGSADIDFFVDNFVVEQIPAPTITSVTSSQTCHDTTKIVIIGTNLTGASAASINGVSLGSLDSNTDTRIVKYMLTPFTSGGNVSVTTAGGAATFGNSLSFSNPPALSLDSPNFTICKGTSALVSLTSTPSNFATYTWSAGVLGSGSGPWTFSPSATTTFNLTATGGGCTKIISRTVTLADTPSRLSLSQGFVKPKCDARIDSLIVSGGIAAGVVALSENFNGATNSWNRTNTSTGGTPAAAAWTLRANGYTYDDGFSLYTFNSNDNSQFYLSNSDEQNGSTSGVTTNTILESPIINLTDFISANLSFFHYYNFGTSPDTAAIEISINGGTSWTRLDFLVADAGTLTGFNQRIITIPAFALNQSNVKIRFNYKASFDWWWAIDNVSITGNKQQNITWSPTAGLFTDRAASAAYSSGHAAKLYSKPSTTTKYYAQAQLGNCIVRDSIIDSANTVANMVVLALASASGAGAQCTDGGWTYYGTASDPDKFIFAINKGASGLTGEYVDVNVNGSPYTIAASSNGTNEEHQSFLMGRDWNVTVSAQPTVPVQVRFFYDPADTTAVNTLRDAAYTTLQGTNSSTFAVKTPFEWFKSKGVPYDATWRASVVGNKFPASTTKKLTPTYGLLNGVNYVEFTVDSFSGGSGGSGFGPAGSGGGVGLPVTWAGFDISTETYFNKLVWKTASEKNTSYFEVEYSYDGSNFESTGERIKAAGNSSELKEYSYSHADLSANIYYRIHQVDLDGRSEYSSVKLAKRALLANSMNVSLFPLPLGNSTELNVRVTSNDKAPIKYTVTDLTGRIILMDTKSIDKNILNFKIPMEMLTQGLYTIEITNGFETVVKRIVK